MTVQGSGATGLPDTLNLKPPPHVGLIVSLMVAGAVFLLVARSEVASQVMALLIVAMAGALVRYARSMSGACLILVDAAIWRHPHHGDTLKLAGSSVRMLGAFWLHGQAEDGKVRHLMLIPGMLAEDDFRRLCVWYENARSGVDSAPD